MKLTTEQHEAAAAALAEYGYGLNDDGFIVITSKDKVSCFRVIYRAGRSRRFHVQDAELGKTWVSSPDVAQAVTTFVESFWYAVKA